MIKKKSILSILTKPRLLELARTWDLPGRSNKGVDDLIDLIAAARSVTPLELLESLRINELKKLCYDREIRVSGKRAELIERLAGQEKQKPARPKETKALTEETKKPAFGDKAREKKPQKDTKNYTHPEQTLAMRPEVGTQASFKHKKPPATYRYDSSLAPELAWDENAARLEGERQLSAVSDQLSEAKRIMAETGNWRLAAEYMGRAEEALGALKAMSRPFLNWAGKAERGEFTIPTLPLFVHERLSTRAIIETLKGHKAGRQIDMFDLFADPQHSIRDQVLRAYEHQDKWVNRMILGDSLTVMNSLLRYESLGGQVQMIYIDPPYGVKFGSNFQPFVRKRDVKHNDDEDMSREPEMVKAYRDTWELGLHSYLVYMRDRLLLARELLHPSGSVFVQISDENVHHVKEIMDEVFGQENFVAIIPFAKTGGQSSTLISSVADFLLWYAKDQPQVKYRQLFLQKERGGTGSGEYSWVEFPDGTRRRLTKEESDNPSQLPYGSRFFIPDNLTSADVTSTGTFHYKYEGAEYFPKGGHWKTTENGLNRLAELDRLIVQGVTLRYVRYFDDFSVSPLANVWMDTAARGWFENKLYVVQTTQKVIQRCILMTTDPGDLVVDPTCGSGTTAYVAEQWGRRWITIDVSRVPLALARQRLLTATFPWYELRDEKRGPGSGFVYKRKQNSKGEEVGGIVPHITLKSIANDLPPDEEVLVDRPEEMSAVTRVTGPFVFEATIPTPVDWEGDGEEDSGLAVEHADFVSRMIEVLRLSPVLHLAGGKTVKISRVRPPAKTLNLSAEAVVQNGKEAPVAVVFGPENGAVSETLIHNAAREASAKNYAHLYVIGFAIQPDARKYVDDCEAITGIAATYVQATPDLLMGDLLKNMRSSQIFSVCGLPEIRIRKAAGKEHKGKLQVELLGLDLFDPATMQADHREGNDVPAWFLDTNYNGTCFHVNQAFFPRTGAWESLKKALKGEYEEGVWDHLSGTVSAPFEPGDKGMVAVKVIDDRGNELIVTKRMEEVE